MTENATTKKVIVVGCKHGGLAIIRALGRIGYYVIAMTPDPKEFGTSSRYVNEVVQCPHPAEIEEFIAFLLQNSELWHNALILETEDYFSTALSKHKSTLSEHYRLVVPDWDVAQLFIEKSLTYAMADECGVPHPAVYHMETMQELDSMAHDLTFPVMLKPLRSHEFVDYFNQKLFIVDDLQTLREKFQLTLETQQPVLLQEIIPGTDNGTLESIEIYIDSAGEVSAEQFNVKLRQAPPMFGVMRAGKSVPPIDDIREYAHRLLRHVQYRGFASLEFKRDKRDGEPKLIEVNIRLPRNGQMLFASGTNFPHIIYQDLVSGQVTKADTYQPTYFIDLIPDLGNTFLRDFRSMLNLPAFLRPYVARHKTFAVFSITDPMPFLSLVGAKVAKVIHLLRRLVGSPKRAVSTAKGSLSED